MQLAGKTALIAGAARGIGRAFATSYIREGAQVAIADVDQAPASQTARGLGDMAFAVQMDVTERSSVDEAVNGTIDHFGQIDIPINNSISPGVVDGERWDGVDAFFAKCENRKLGQRSQEVSDALPFGRMGTADDLTGMAVFLASEAANYIDAQTYNVDGGQWMS
jgi:NAD(P)-dependent dehydrogenase (short-subunit alcohol dehydrogenase family)